MAVREGRIMRGRGRSGVRGAAMIEFVVLTIVMVPLLFGVSMLGKLIDVEQTAVQASRYAVWETTVGAAEAPASLSARFFAHESAPLSSTARDARPHSLWGDDSLARGPRAETHVKVDPGAAAALPYTAARGDEDGFSVAASVGGAVRGAGRAMSDFGAFGGLGGETEWDLASDGLTRGGVRVDVARNGWLERGSGGCFSAAAYACLEETGVILADGWSAGDDTQAARRVRSLVPASALSRFGDVVAIAGKLPLFKELDGLKGAFGKVDVSLLPASENNRRPLERYEAAR